MPTEGPHWCLCLFCQKLWQGIKAGQLSVWRTGSLHSCWGGRGRGEVVVTGLSRRDPDFKSLALITRLSFLPYKATLSHLFLASLQYSRFQRFSFLNQRSMELLRVSMEEFKVVPENSEII